MPTNITKLVFTQGTGNAVADWTTTIGGAILYNSTDMTSIPVSATVVGSTSIELDFHRGQPGD